MPFSKGLLANSILSAGVPHDVAFRVAGAVERVLNSTQRREVTTELLTDVTASALRNEVGEKEAERYVRWRELHQSGRPIIVVLGGSPGVGKSTLASRLAVRLGISRIVTTDAIREVLRTVVPPSVLPELHLSTYQTVALDDPADGPLLGFRRQARAVSAATAAVARRHCIERRGLVIEGTHVVPGELRDALRNEFPDAVVVERLLVLHDAEAHQHQLTLRLSQQPARAAGHLEHLETLFEIQRLLVAIAERAGVESFDVTGAAHLTRNVVDELVETVPGEAPT